MHTSKTYLPGIAANLTALQAIIATARQDIEHGVEAAGQGNQNGAIGSIIPTEYMLRQAGILLQAILVLHCQTKE
jgi:hypothetical protein